VKARGLIVRYPGPALRGSRNERLLRGRKRP
jgi:hypothetical protein